MPVTKFEGYNASDVRSCQEKLAGAGLRGFVAADGARQRAPVSRDQSLALSSFVTGFADAKVRISARH